MGHDFVGMYLYGSLALGDFDPESSDVDVLVATAFVLSPEIVAALQRMHEELKADDHDEEWANRLEVSYIPVSALRRYDPADARHPFISTVSDFSVIEHGRDWIINRYVIREAGVVVSGPSPHTLIDPITRDELQAAVRYILCNSWIQHTYGPEWMRQRKYQAFTVLTMCRVWYALEQGAVASKSQAAEWAQAALDPQWKGLIQQALAWRGDLHTNNMTMTETLRFLRHTIGSHCSPRLSFIGAGVNAEPMDYADGRDEDALASGAHPIYGLAPSAPCEQGE